MTGAQPSLRQAFAADIPGMQHVRRSVRETAC